MVRVLALVALLLFTVPAAAADYVLPPKKVVLRYLKVTCRREWS